MTYPINALYGSGYSYNPVSDGYADATTADTVQRMNALYSGPGGALRSLRNAIPQGSDGLSILNMARSGLGTAANWLQGTPEIGPDTLAPLGLGSMGTGVMNALTRASPDARIAKSLMESHPDAISLGQMWRSPSSVSVTSPGGDALVRGENRGALQRAASGGQYAITRPDPDVYGVADNVNVAGPAAVRDQKPSTSMPRERTPEEREAQFKEWQKESMAIRRGKEQMASGRFDVDGLSRIPADPRYSEFDSFLAGNKRDAWITVDGDLAIHARRTPGGIVLSNISTDRPGGGKFTSFLNRYEPQVSFQIENIQNARLPDYLRKRGYAVYGDAGIPQAVRPAGPSLLADNARSSAPGTVVNSVAEQPQTIRAYHGSPHDFDKFSMDRIGTGEGSQAFGYGLYFAENPKTADSYRPRSLNPFSKRPGRSYEVDIRARPEEFIDLDLPMAAQPKSLRETLLRVLDDQMNKKGWPEDYKKYMRDRVSSAGTTQDAMNTFNGAFYRETTTPGTWEADAAAALKDAGIKGTRFFDAGSRDKQSGTRNYVVFDDSLVDINRKYARPDIASAPGLAVNSTQQSSDSGVLDILRKYGLPTE